MPAWIIKSQTDDPDRALEIIADQRSRGYNAWIEDENGVAVDEESLRINGRTPIKRILTEGLTGPLVLVASVVTGFVFLYLIGLLVDS